jgi:hypothetical protein
MAAQCGPSMWTTIRGTRVESLRIHCDFSFVHLFPPSLPSSLPRSLTLLISPILLSSHYAAFRRISSHWITLPRLSLAFPLTLRDRTPPYPPGSGAELHRQGRRKSLARIRGIAGEYSSTTPDFVFHFWFACA